MKRKLNHGSSICRLLVLVATCFSIEVRALEVLTNQWIRSGTDAFASTDANWSLGYAPTNTATVVFLGQQATVPDLTWDLTNSVAGWVQTADYTGTVTVAKSAEMRFKVSGDILLESGDLVFAGDTTAIGGGTEAVKHGIGYTVEADNVYIGSNASLNADKQGFPQNSGPGRPREGNRGASHGGEGGNGSIGLSSHGPPVTYGEAYGPTALGSGGYAVSSGTGMAGGGAIKLTVSGICRVDGRLSADASYLDASNLRGASGGSLWIRAGRLVGTGVISASGSDGYSLAMAGGGGGRIDISETVNDFAGQINVLGGCWNKDNNLRGLAGTIAFPQSAGSGLTLNHFVPYTNIAMGFSRPISNAVVNAGIVLWLEAVSNRNVHVFDSLVVTGTLESAGQVICGGNVGQPNAASGGTLAMPHGVGVEIKARSLVIHAGGIIHANAQGYGGGSGAGKSPKTGWGGTYGGIGGVSSLGYSMPPEYGTPSAPTALGSGGNAGAPAGGAIALDVSETLVINGKLTADAPKSTGSNSGGGSGGSIWIRAPRLQGSGLISASGGDGVTTAHAGGGGGRIDISETINDFNGDIRVWGGHANFLSLLRGKVGTLLLPQSAGTGWTLDSLIVTNQIKIGYDIGFSRIEVRPGGTLYFDSQTNRWSYNVDTLSVEGSAEAPARVVCLADHTAANTASGGTPSIPHGIGTFINANVISVNQWGIIDADGGGYVGLTGPSAGGAQENAGSHGGRGARLTGTGVCYGVISAPGALGSGGGKSGSASGGALYLSGAVVTNNGIIRANGPVGTRNHAGGSGGSVWIECGELLGTGSVQAKGGYTENSRPGGGGRIAVVLTNAPLSSLQNLMSAAGGPKNADAPYNAAAGTVFLAGLESGGLISQRLVIDNAGQTTVDPVWTELPPQITGDEETFRGTVLELSDAGHVGLTSDSFVKDLFLSEDTTLRLNGYTLRVDSYRHPDWGDEAWVVYDGGQIIWRGATMLIVR